MIKPKLSVRFDPDNIEHIAAMDSILRTGKLHPTLRFDVERPFHNAVDMAKHLMATRYASLVLRKEFVDVRENDPLKATEADLQPELFPAFSSTSTPEKEVAASQKVRNLANIVTLNFGSRNANSLR